LWDTLHATAGTLNLKMSGRPIVPPLADEELAALRESWHWPVTADPREHNRRGIYILVRRNFRFPLFDVFDAPVNSVSAANRDVTTVAPQALWFLNNQTSQRQAREFAARLVREEIAGWNQPDFGGGQTGWLGRKGGERAGWAKRMENGPLAPDFDVLPGTVMTHGPSSVLWKVPLEATHGVLNLSGSLWNVRRQGASGAWKLWKNDETLLSEGTIDDSLGTSDKPLSLTSGSGGSRALRDVACVGGDTLRLEILETNYVAVKLKIKAGRTNDLASDFSLEANPTPTGWQYSESLANGGVVVGPALKPARWVENAWQIALARPPSIQEKQEALRLIQTLARGSADPKPPDNLPPMLASLSPKQVAALTDFCLAIFSLNEFVYVD
jgi:hypothetical protein